MKNFYVIALCCLTFNCCTLDYELSQDATLLPLAVKYTEALKEAQYLTWHHDIGFIISCSFGNGFRLTGRPEYKEVIVQAARSLASPAYRAKLGTNGHFLLLHSVGSILHNAEIDVPLIYADYYFLEALKRKKDLGR